MARIAILGVGRIGTAAAKMLLSLTDHELFLIDKNQEALIAAFAACSVTPRPSVRVAMSPQIQVELFHSENLNELQATIQQIRPDVVLCATPSDVNVRVAEICMYQRVNYIDFTEDEEVAGNIAKMDVQDCTFVPQTGLAPGLVNYFGLSLFEKLGQPMCLELRAGELPQVSEGPEHYAITSSPHGLVNQFYQNGTRKVNNEVLASLPFQDVKSFRVNGVEYEEVSTAGGIGMLSAYENIPSVQYKTLRYKGHSGALKDLIHGRSFEDAVRVLQDTFISTRDDIVALAAMAIDEKRMSSSIGLHFYPCEELDITALELTTAGTGVAILQLMLAGKLPKGVLNASDIPFDALMGTEACQLIFEYMV